MIAHGKGFRLCVVIYTLIVDRNSGEGVAATATGVTAVISGDRSCSRLIPLPPFGTAVAVVVASHSPLAC